MRTNLLLAVLILPLAASWSLADTTLQQGYTTRATAALRLWEVPRDQYLRLTRLTSAEEADLEAYLRRAQLGAPSMDGVALLVALNCGAIPEGKSVFRAVADYRCKGQPLSFLADAAIRSGDLYMFAFVKPEHRHRTIEFLRRYLAFWKDEVTRGDLGMPAPSLDLVMLEEVGAFLDEGGYL